MTLTLLDRFYATVAKRCVKYCTITSDTVFQSFFVLLSRTFFEAISCCNNLPWMFYNAIVPIDLLRGRESPEDRIMFFSLLMFSSSSKHVVGPSRLLRETLHSQLGVSFILYLTAAIQ